MWNGKKVHFTVSNEYCFLYLIIGHLNMRSLNMVLYGKPYGSLHKKVLICATCVGSLMACRRFWLSSRAEWSIR
jgi:hypothetical protein